MIKMLQASMKDHEEKAEEMVGTFLGEAKNDVRELTEGFLKSLDEKMGEYLSDIETKKDDYHWDDSQCDNLRGEIINLFNYKNICKNELGIEDEEEEGEETESDNEEDTKTLLVVDSKEKVAAKKRGRPTKKVSDSKGSSSSSSESVPKKRGRPMKNPSGKPLSYIVEVGTKIMYEEEEYIAVDSRVGGPGMCQIGVSKNGKKEIVEYDEDRGHMKKAEVSKLLRKGATIYES